jgi:molybdate transport system ATP-binding protein
VSQALIAGGAPQPEVPLLVADAITVRVRERHLFAGTSWRICSGEHWALLGPNGSGKTSLLRALVGLGATSAGHVHHLLPGGAQAVAYLSFEEQEAVVRREQDREARGQSGQAETPGATARELAFSGAHPQESARLAAILDLRPFLDREARALSTGEMRRTLLAGALSGCPGLLILDEPYDGLDAASRAAFRELLRSQMRAGIPTVVATHRREELVPETTHVLLVREGRVVASGGRAAVLGSQEYRELYETQPGIAADGGAGRQAPCRPDGEPLVEMRGVRVRWGDTVALDGLDWVVRRGEHWAILGPNGSGKSTVLELVYGDNQQAYANDVRLFGRRRGSGESLWEIRARIGIVSAALQVRYRSAATVREVVASGFHDSVGLHRRPTAGEDAAAEQAILDLGLAHLAERSYAELSSGERRMVLVARALVKKPELLILDEPCEGLDPTNRRKVLEMVDAIGRGGGTSLVYVSHVETDLPRCISRVLRLPGRLSSGARWAPTEAR